MEDKIGAGEKGHSMEINKLLIKDIKIKKKPAGKYEELHAGCYFRQSVEVVLGDEK